MSREALATVIQKHFFNSLHVVSPSDVEWCGRFADAILAAGFALLTPTEDDGATAREIVADFKQARSAYGEHLDGLESAVREALAAKGARQREADAKLYCRHCADGKPWFESALHHDDRQPPQKTFIHFDGPHDVAVPCDAAAIRGGK